MEIEMKIISTEIIKPSSPTPKSLQKHQLSFLDQIAPPIFMPLVYLYSSNPQIPNSQKSNHLKKSLSEILSRFYPLAGRLVGNLYIDCNDGGVPFVEAEANYDLSQVITNPYRNGTKKLFPYELIESRQDLCMAVQATYFRCGGLTVGLLISHNIADAVSMVVFTNTWCTVARNGGGGGGGGGVPIPKFDAAAYFPPIENISGFDAGEVYKPDDVVTRNFTFPAARIAALQETYAAANGRRPSRVDALSAYIWTRLLLATGTQNDPTKIYSLQSVVNLRNLVDPPMSEYHFGNLIFMLIAAPEAGDGGAELVQKLKEAKKAMHDGMGSELNVMDVINVLTSRANAGERVVSFMFTSLCGFPLYEADFGWGKPVSIVSPGFPYKNVAAFSDAKCGGGIDVLIHQSKPDMERFEADFELQMLKSNL